MPAFFDKISTLLLACCHHSFANESNHLCPYLQKRDDIIIMVILKFCQKMLACKLSHPLNLENEIFTVETQFATTVIRNEIYGRCLSCFI